MVIANRMGASGSPCWTPQADERKDFLNVRDDGWASIAILPILIVRTTLTTRHPSVGRRLARLVMPQECRQILEAQPSERHCKKNPRISPHSRNSRASWSLPDWRKAARRYDDRPVVQGATAGLGRDSGGCTMPKPPAKIWTIESRWRSRS